MNGSTIMIFTGKGGVGKTSLISAHALPSARMGARTLLVRADMAHTLGDNFEVETGGRLTRIEENLDILELDPFRIMQEEFPQVNRAVLEMLSGKKSVPDAAGRFMVPGFEDLFSLLKIKKIYEEGTYRRIFVDCAPSGETLSLLRLPEMLSWYIEKFFPVGKAMTRILRPVSGTLFKVQLPDGGAMDEFSDLFKELNALQGILRDPAVTGVRIVCIPEKMVVEETKRTYMYLNLYGYHVGRVFINRVIGEQQGNAFMARWREIQREYIDELERVFSRIPITQIRWHETEICGRQALMELCAELPEPDELFAAADTDAGETYEAEGDGYRLRVSLPGLAADGSGAAAGEDDGGPEVARFGRDLDIRAGNCLRRIPLPDALRQMDIKEVRREKDALTVLFLPAGAQ